MEFKIGDRVVCTGKVDGLFNTTGEHGVVISSGGDNLTVQFDNPIPGAHNGGGTGLWGHCLFVGPEILRLESQVNPFIPAAEREYITL